MSHVDVIEPSLGLTHADIQKLSVTPDLLEDVTAALTSSEDKDVAFGLFFLEALAPRLPEFSKEFSANLQDRLPVLLKSENVQVRKIATKLFVQSKHYFANYREVMLSCLNDKSPVVRKTALMAYPSYMKEKEYSPLEAFERDDYLTEIGMGSHLVYELRNEALEMLEKVIGRSFEKEECTAALESGEVAFWWNWEPYHKWKKRWWRIF